MHDDHRGPRPAGRRRSTRRTPRPTCATAFLLPDGVVYLDGNSLGALPAAVPDAVADVVRAAVGRGPDRARGTTHGWWSAPPRVGDRVGAAARRGAGQVLVRRLHHRAAVQGADVAARSGCGPGGRVARRRPGVVPDRPVRARRRSPRDSAARSCRDAAGDAGRPRGARVDDVAVVCLLPRRLPHRRAVGPGRRHRAQRTTAGALALWDLCHSAGALARRPRRAAASTSPSAARYKYLNGGPGCARRSSTSPAGTRTAFEQPLTGWNGHADPFAMAAASTRRPTASTGRASGTPPMLSLLALEAALDAFDGVALGRRPGRARCRLTGFFLELPRRRSCPGSDVVTPREPDDARGSQVALRHPDGVRRGAGADRPRRGRRLPRAGHRAARVRAAVPDARRLLRAARELAQVLAAGEHRTTRARAPVRRHLTAGRAARGVTPRA